MRVVTRPEVRAAGAPAHWHYERFVNSTVVDGDELRRLAEQVDLPTRLTLATAIVHARGLTRHQVEAYDRFMDVGLPEIVSEERSVVVDSEQSQRRHVIEFGNVTVHKPSVREADGTVRPVYPRECRLRGLVYACTVTCDLTYTTYDIASLTKDDLRRMGKDCSALRPCRTVVSREAVLCQIPCMVGSRYCRLRGSPYLSGECPLDRPGTFVVRGSVKMLVSQIKTRINHPCVMENRARDRYSHVCEIRPRHESKIRSTSTLYLYLLVARPQVEVRMPFVDALVPLADVFRLLGVERLDEMRALVIAHAPTHGDAAAIDRLMRLADQVFDQDDHPGWSQQALAEWLGSKGTRGGTGREGASEGVQRPSAPAERVRFVEHIIGNEFMPHVGLDRSRDTCLRKAHALAGCAFRLLACSVGLIPLDDRDHMALKRIDTAAVLLPTLFRPLFRSLCKGASTRIKRAAARGDEIFVATLLDNRRVTSVLRYAFTTGNWGVQKGAATATGVAQVHNRMTVTSILSNLRRLNMPINKEGKLPHVRQLRDPVRGLTCIIETPEGSACGLVTNLALLTHVRTGHDRSLVATTVRQAARAFSPDGLGDVVGQAHSAARHGRALVLVNGVAEGYTHDDGTLLAESLRVMRSAGALPFDASIVHKPALRTLDVHVDAGCLVWPLLRVDGLHRVRPLLARYGRGPPGALLQALLCEGVIEYVSKDEEETYRVATEPADLVDPAQQRTGTRPDGRTARDREPFTHVEVHPIACMGVCASLIPFMDHNQAPRNTYQTAMGKQSIAAPALNSDHATDTISQAIYYPQVPLVQTAFEDVVGATKQPMGQNIRVAVLCDPYDQEDALVLSRRAVDLGLFRSVVRRTYRDDEKTRGADSTRFCQPQHEQCVGLRKADYSKLTRYGFAPPGTRLIPGDALIGKVCHTDEARDPDPSASSAATTGSGTRIVKRDRSTILRTNEAVTVHRVFRTFNADSAPAIKINVRAMRQPEEGSKLCFDTRTEVLTHLGWTTVDAIDPLVHRIAALAPLPGRPDTRVLTYERPTAVYCYTHEKHERLVRVRSHRVDLVVTPSHRMWALPSSDSLVDGSAACGRSPTLMPARDMLAPDDHSQHADAPLARRRHRRHYYYQKNAPGWVPERHPLVGRRTDGGVDVTMLVDFEDRLSTLSMLTLSPRGIPADSTQCHAQQHDHPSSSSSSSLSSSFLSACPPALSSSTVSSFPFTMQQLQQHQWKEAQALAKDDTSLWKQRSIGQGVGRPGWLFPASAFGLRTAHDVGWPSAGAPSLSGNGDPDMEWLWIVGAWVAHAIPWKTFSTLSAPTAQDGADECEFPGQEYHVTAHTHWLGRFVKRYCTDAKGSRAFPPWTWSLSASQCAILAGAFLDHLERLPSDGVGAVDALEIRALAPAHDRNVADQAQRLCLHAGWTCDVRHDDAGGGPAKLHCTRRSGQRPFLVCGGPCHETTLSDMARPTAKIVKKNKNNNPANNPTKRNNNNPANNNLDNLDNLDNSIDPYKKNKNNPTKVKKTIKKKKSQAKRKDDRSEEKVERAEWQDGHDKECEPHIPSPRWPDRKTAATTAADTSSSTLQQSAAPPRQQHPPTTEPTKPIDERVWCVSVPSQVILVRRNGVACWTGNSTRHGQKVTVGRVRNVEDMPWSHVTGQPPDAIVNPHAIPSRMTIGQTLEGLTGKVAQLDAFLVDGTPFGGITAEQVGEMLVAHGYERYGKELMYHPHTGLPFEALVCVQPLYYQCLRHVAIDKIHARARGPVQMLTKQPVEGRSRDGGFRLGEMERDCIISHGASNFLLERLFEQSDAYSTVVCAQCGLLAMPAKPSSGRVAGMSVRGYDQPYCLVCQTGAHVRDVRMPYACKLLAQELMACRIAFRFQFDSRPALSQPREPLPVALVDEALPHARAPHPSVSTLTVPLSCAPSLPSTSVTTAEMATAQMPTERTRTTTTRASDARARSTCTSQPGSNRTTSSTDDLPPLSKAHPAKQQLGQQPGQQPGQQQEYARLVQAQPEGAHQILGGISVLSTIPSDVFQGVLKRVESMLLDERADPHRGCQPSGDHTSPAVLPSTDSHDDDVACHVLTTPTTTTTTTETNSPSPTTSTSSTAGLPHTGQRFHTTLLPIACDSQPHQDLVDDRFHLKRPHLDGGSCVEQAVPTDRPTHAGADDGRIVVPIHAQFTDDVENLRGSDRHHDDVARDGD